MGMPAYLQPDLEADLILPSTPAGRVNYQDRTAFLFLFFPSLLLVLRSWLWGWMLIGIVCSALPGMVVNSLHRFGFARMEVIFAHGSFSLFSELCQNLDENVKMHWIFFCESYLPPRLICIQPQNMLMLALVLMYVDKTSLLRYGHGTYQSHLGDPEAERGATVPSMGYHARSCNASTK